MKNSSPHGFTLIEMMVSMTILSILLILFSQIVNRTTQSTSATTRYLTIATSCRVVLDRIQADIAGMESGTTATLIVLKNVDLASSSKVNDSLVMITNSRTQQREGGESPEEIRCGVKAYRIEMSPDPDEPERSLPLLTCGGGTLTWSESNRRQVKSSFRKALAAAIQDVQSVSTEGEMLEFQSLAPGVFRLEVSFLLNDGTIIATPPTSRSFNDFKSGNVYPVAFSEEDSTDPQQLYVKSIIVSLVGLDHASFQSINSNPENLSRLMDAFVDPEAAQTPLNSWDMSQNSSLRESLLPPLFPKTILGSFRAFQRYYYVR